MPHIACARAREREKCFPASEAPEDSRTPVGARSLVRGAMPRWAQTPLAVADTLCVRTPARRRHTSEIPERAQRSGLSGRCLAAQTRRARGPARARGRLGRGGGARSPPATRAALRPARGVCTGLGPVGPMFTELRTKLSPPRGRAGAVRAGFGERRDVDGERGWSRERGYRGLGVEDREGRERDLADSDRRRRVGWGRVVAERGPWCLCPELRAGASGLRPWGSAHPWLGGGDRPGLLSPGWHHRAVTFFLARRKPSPALALGRRGRGYSRAGVPPPHFLLEF